MSAHTPDAANEPTPLSGSVIPDTLFEEYDRWTLDAIVSGLAVLYLAHTTTSIAWLASVGWVACLIWWNDRD